MKATPTEVERFLRLLAETPLRIEFACEDLTEPRFGLRPDEYTWSVNDILAHLRSCADVWGTSIRRMLDEDNPTLPYVSPRSWIRRTNYLDLTLSESFRAFVGQRRELLILLQELAFEDWSRAAMINGREHTIFSQTRRMALHEIEHCEQIETLVKSMG